MGYKRYFINSKGLEFFKIVVNDSVENTKKFHTDGYLEIAWNRWTRFQDERRSTYPEQEQDKFLDSWGLNTHAKDDWLYLPFDFLLKLQNSR